MSLTKPICEQELALASSRAFRKTVKKNNIQTVRLQNIANRTLPRMMRAVPSGLCDVAARHHGRRAEAHTTVDIDFKMSKQVFADDFSILQEILKTRARLRHRTHTNIHMLYTVNTNTTCIADTSRDSGVHLRAGTLSSSNLCQYNVQLVVTLFSPLRQSKLCDSCAFECATSDGAHHCDGQTSSSNINDRLYCPNDYKFRIKLRSRSTHEHPHVTSGCCSLRNPRLTQKPHLKTHRTRCAHERVFLSQASWNHNESVTCEKGAVLESTHHMSSLQAIGQGDSTLIANIVEVKT